ncbi:MAG: RHS repeat-associated core domain-containing protein [Caldilineaceae bacterium]
MGDAFATSNRSGNFRGQQWYHAYGRFRGGYQLGTENRFTGQKLDGAGLMYFNARYYDPELGQFMAILPACHPTLPKWKGELVGCCAGW